MPDLPENNSNKTGLNLIEMGDLPPIYRRIFRIALRRLQFTFDELLTDLGDVSADDQKSIEAINATLYDMVERTWLHKSEEDGRTIYSMNIRKRAPRKLMSLQLNQYRASSYGNLQTMLQVRESLGEFESDIISAIPVQVRTFADRMAVASARLLGENRILVMMLFLYIVNTFALGVLDVVAVGGFVNKLGTNNIPWLVIMDMLVSLVISGTYIQFIDKVPRARMMRLVLACLGGVYLVLSGLFLVSFPTGILYPIMYLLRTQQVLLFPIIFWNLANNLYSLTEARRIFPILAAGEMIGGLLGYSLFSLPAMFGMHDLVTSDDAAFLMALSALLTLLSLFLFSIVLKDKKTPPEKSVSDNEASPVENIREGFKTINEIPLFRYLAILVFCEWIAFGILWIHFYVSLDTATTQAGSFESFYSIYNIASMLVPLFFQLWITVWLAKKIPAKGAFLLLPISLVVSIPFALIWQTPYIGVLVIFLTYALYQAWEQPTFNSMLNLIPEERRGRISTLLGNYSYALGSLSGNFIVGMILLVSPALGWSAQLTTTLYLSVAFTASLAAIWAAYKVYRTYDDSMLSWRLTRRSRGAAVLDKLEF